MSDNDGDNRTEYVRDANGQVLMQRTVNGTYYYLVDGLGSILQMTDSAGAPQLTDLYKYEPYGAMIFSNTPVSNRWVRHRPAAAPPARAASAALRPPAGPRGARAPEPGRLAA
ncbi:MAG TPA: hypothetical protein VFW96_27005 [Thermomicrobiales bacterium]|nr:hypothetical protein [Thermomicrobiales bacterium]